MEAVTALRAAGNTDPGLQRDVNEDRFHFDVSRGLFMVVDGVGGQAAGGKAADTAVTMLRARLERETGPAVSRLREAIAIANNEIHRLAGLRPEWNGMACVLTAVIVRDSHAIVGHVGDTRLYKLRHDRIEKVTSDHSPVGEREDAFELSELEAMHHPRRNEVYRDVGSELHEPADPDFIDVREIPFEPDAALLLCSDGLTDSIDSSSINEIVRHLAGRPAQVVQALIDAANDAGGKDNITVVYIEGEQFLSTGRRDRRDRRDRPDNEAPPTVSEITRRLGPAPLEAEVPTPVEGEDTTLDTADTGRRTSQAVVRSSIIALIAVLLVLTLGRSTGVPPNTPPLGSAAVDTGRIVVQAPESLAQALQGARAGTTIVVEPGEYRETLTLRSHVWLVSSVPGSAIIRLPGTASEAAAAVVAVGVTGAALDGFRIVGDAATPLGTGVMVVDSELSISQVEITGAARTAIDVHKGSRVRIVASDIHDNPGSAVAVRSGATATISHGVFTRNGTAGGARELIVEENSAPKFVANVFVGSGPNALAVSSEARAAFARNNWFVDVRTPRATRPTSGTAERRR